MDRDESLRTYDSQFINLNAILTIIPKKNKKKTKYFNKIIPFVWQAIKWVRNTRTQAFFNVTAITVQRNKH